MPLSINHNLMASNTARHLGMSYAELSSSVAKLSSGLRVNSAADDAAGLAIRELMRADIASLNQGIRNANDAISLIQTADGALSVIDEKLIRMKELAEQAATGTYNSDQRIIIDSEYQAMANEITRIANATDFNGIYLLNGGLSGTHDGSALNSTGQLKVHFGSGNDSSEDYYYINIGSATASSLGFGGGSGASSGPLSRAEILALNPGMSLLIHAPSWNLGDGFLYDSTSIAVRNQFPNQDYDVFTDSSNDRYAVLIDNNGNQRVLHYDIGLTYLGEGGLNMTRSGSGGTSPSSISTQQLAQQALGTVQNAIVSKDKIRAKLGALQNRLENTITNLEIQSENLQAAESRISDVDVATEMTEFVRSQILTQAATAMLAQANSLPRMAMQLIGG